MMDCRIIPHTILIIITFSTKHVLTSSFTINFIMDAALLFLILACKMMDFQIIINIELIHLYLFIFIIDVN